MVRGGSIPLSISPEANTEALVKAAMTKVIVDKYLNNATPVPSYVKMRCARKVRSNGVNQAL
jgi:ribosomal protein L39E